jgi:DMSO reductase anchor subunit
MHPAYSVILFTTASGAGYALIVWLAFSALLGLVPPERGLGLIGYGLAFGLVTGGLLSSTAHLGRPERAWRALSQWRTSWLSREGMMAVATYAPAGALALGWVILESTAGLFQLAAALAIVFAVAILFTTGMIYASLKTIRQWHQPLTAPIYTVLGLASGAVLLNLVLQLFGAAGAWSGWLASALLLIGLGLKAAYWRARSMRQERPTPSRPRRGSSTSARCVRWSRRTPSPTSSCARWATISDASMPRGCAALPSRSASWRLSAARCSPWCLAPSPASGAPRLPR